MMVFLKMINGSLNGTSIEGNKVSFEEGSLMGDEIIGVDVVECFLEAKGGQIGVLQKKGSDINGLQRQ